MPKAGISTALLKAEISTAELREVAARIKVLRQKATEHAAEIGRELLRAKTRLPYGAFVGWVEKECEFKIRTAQNLMKLAREVDANKDVAAVMVPSTLRLYLSKTTPPSVKQLVKARLENGERVSRNDLSSAILEARAKPINDNRAEPTSDPRGIAPGEFVAADGTTAGHETDRSRNVAELIFHRLSREDYEYVIDGMNAGAWHRVLIWLGSMRIAASEQADSARHVATRSAAVPAA